MFRLEHLHRLDSDLSFLRFNSSSQVPIESRRVSRCYVGLGNGFFWGLVACWGGLIRERDAFFFSGVADEKELGVELIFCTLVSVQLQVTSIYIFFAFFGLFLRLRSNWGPRKARSEGTSRPVFPFRSSSFHSPFPPHHKHKQGGPRKRSASSLYVKDRSKPLELKKRVEMERRGWASKNDRSKRTRVMKRSPRKERSRYRAEKRESRKDKEMGITGN